LPNVEKEDVYYHGNLIEKDPDDNKYVDCEIAANATYIVSEDADFRVLKRVSFPTVSLLTADEFLVILDQPDLFQG
jgi:predicted nucleic acid-binding protein